MPPPTLMPGPDGDHGHGRPRWPLIAVAVVVAAAAALVGYWLSTRGADDGQPRASDPSSASTTSPAPHRVALNLPAPWAETERVGRTVTYREPDRDLLARVSATPSDQPVRTVAEEELDRVSAAAGYHLAPSRELPADQRPGWDDGWLIEYGYLIDGQRRIQQAWYVGDAGHTSGFVAVAAPEGRLATVTHLLPTALESLPH